MDTMNTTNVMNVMNAMNAMNTMNATMNVIIYQKNHANLNKLK